MDYLPFVMLLAAAGAKHFPQWMLRAVTLTGMVVEIWASAGSHTKAGSFYYALRRFSTPFDALEFVFCCDHGESFGMIY
jgi:hypothetical protein